MSEAREPSMAQMRKFFAMTGEGKMPEQLFQLFIEDPWRILDAIWFRSYDPCDIPSLSGALISSCLRLGMNLREEDIPWKPEVINDESKKFAYLRLQNIGGHWAVPEIKKRLDGGNLLPGTLSDLLRLARWDRGLYWAIPVVALGWPILKEEMGRTRTYYPVMSERTLFVTSTEEVEVGKDKVFFLGRVKM